MTVEQALVVTVADVLEQASLGVTGLLSKLVAENSPFSAVATLKGTPIGDVAWTLEGVDAAAFGIDARTGDLSMAARDYENPEDANRDNDYEVFVRATDEDENTAAAKILVRVTDVSEVRDLTVTGLSSGTIAENSGYSATPMLEGMPIGAVAWTVAGVDAAKFAIEGAAGGLTMAAQDFEAPADSGADNGYDVTVQGTDEDQNTASVSVYGHRNRRGRAIQRTHRRVDRRHDRRERGVAFADPDRDRRDRIGYLDQGRCGCRSLRDRSGLRGPEAAGTGLRGARR